MYPNTLDELSPEQRAVIAWFYSLSNRKRSLRITGFSA